MQLCSTGRENSFSTSRVVPSKGSIMATPILANRTIEKPKKNLTYNEITMSTWEIGYNSLSTDYVANQATIQMDTGFNVNKY